MKCTICGKEIIKDLYIYRNAVTCYECVMSDCCKDINNSLYIDSYFRDVDKFMCVYNIHTLNYKRKLKDSTNKYNKTKNMLYKMDMKYYKRKIKELEELIK